MKRAYLTIDDGPSESFRTLIDFLKKRNVPAVFFNRGDAMGARPDDVVYGIQQGFLMANHAYSHQRFSELSFEEGCAEILKTEAVLDDLYKKAGVQRLGKYFRFPYMDRGMGAALVEPEKLPSEHHTPIQHLLTHGLGHTPSFNPNSKPNPNSNPNSSEDSSLSRIALCKIKRKRDYQNFLKEQGFEKLPTPNVTLPWFAETEMAEAIDSLCTFSTSDWALSGRHNGQHGFHSVADLKAQIDNDPWLHDESSAHIVLAHDQAEIHDVTCALVDYFLETGWEFLDFISQSDYE